MDHFNKHSVHPPAKPAAHRDTHRPIVVIITNRPPTVFTTSKITPMFLVYHFYRLNTNPLRMNTYPHHHHHLRANPPTSSHPPSAHRHLHLKLFRHIPTIHPPNVTHARQCLERPHHIHTYNRVDLHCNLLSLNPSPIHTNIYPILSILPKSIPRTPHLPPAMNPGRAPGPFTSRRTSRWPSCLSFGS